MSVVCGETSRLCMNHDVCQTRTNDNSHAVKCSHYAGILCTSVSWTWPGFELVDYELIIKHVISLSVIGGSGLIKGGFTCAWWSNSIWLVKNADSAIYFTLMFASSKDIERTCIGTDAYLRLRKDTRTPTSACMHILWTAWISEHTLNWINSKRDYEGRDTHTHTRTHTHTHTYIHTMICMHAHTISCIDSKQKLRRRWHKIWSHTHTHTHTMDRERRGWERITTHAQINTQTHA